MPLDHPDSYAMIGFHTAIDGVARQIAQADSIDSLRKCLPTVRNVFSLRHVTYRQWRAAAATPSLVLSTLSEAWEAEYESRQVSEWDPIAKAALQSVLPVDWESVNWKTPDARRFRLMLERHDLGIQGMTLPVHGPQGDVALFWFAGAAADPPRWEGFRRQRDGEMAMIALLFHDRALFLAKSLASQRGVRLTPKVEACLELLAQGRKPAEIATQLGVSVHTVRKHLNRAVDDLSCQTKAQAITRALALGLIRLRSATTLCVYPICIMATAFEVLL